MRWMDLPGPTDVRFPDGRAGSRVGGRMPPSPGRRCSATSCCARVRGRQAAAAGHELEHELALLTVHGVLHLLGYDHAEPDEEKEMFDLQRRPSRGLVRRPGRSCTAGHGRAGGTGICWTNTSRFPLHPDES